MSAQLIRNHAEDARPRSGDASCIQAEEEPMEAAPILICYDGSDGANRAIAAAAAPLKSRRATRELLQGSVLHEVVEHNR